MLGAGAPGRLGLLLATLAPAAGFLAPDLWLARAAAARARAARRELPPMLDLLRVTVEAGASLPEALRAVGREGRGPLAAEWRAAGGAPGSGAARPALRDVQRRLPLPELQALVGALERSRRHGVPLADTLTAQSRDARAALARASREHAARAGPKIQLVVALLLVPSVLLLVAAALVSALLGSNETLLRLGLVASCKEACSNRRLHARLRPNGGDGWTRPAFGAAQPTSPTGRLRLYEAPLRRSRRRPEAPGRRLGGAWCCIVGVSGVMWRSSSDRSGGAPPTPPLRSDSSPWVLAAFRGHYEHSLDAKNRLSIPARFRAPFSSGVVLAKDPETCVAVWTPETHEAIIERALGG